MKISIESRTLRTDRWYPIFDVIIFYLEKERHTFSEELLAEILESPWMRAKGKDDRDLVILCAKAGSHDQLAHKALVRIDDRAPRGGRVDDEYSSSLHPLDCITFLSHAYSVIVENEWFDGAFLLWMAKAVGRENFINTYRANRFVFRHAGGKDSLTRSASVLSQGVWPAPKGRRSRAMRHWACAVLDNDSRFPGDDPNTPIVEELKPLVSFVHQLARRSIESYLPHTTLTAFDGTQAFKEKVDALFRLSPEQKRHYHMKRGFRLGKITHSSKADYAESNDVDVQEKALFGNIPDDDWSKLADGSGRHLSSIFVEDRHRPSKADKSALDVADASEVRELIDAIYKRI